MSRWLRSGGVDEEAEVEEEPLLSRAQHSVGSFAGNLGSRLGLTPAPPPPPRTCLEGILDRVFSCFPALSYTTRLAGFFFFFILGVMLSITSLSSFGSVLLGNPGPFAFKYTVGNLLSIFSMCFLSGPQKQCAGMCSKARRGATLMYAGSLIATLVCVFYLRSWLLTMVAVAAQFIAM